MRKMFEFGRIAAVLRKVASCGVLIGAAAPSFGIIIGSHKINTDQTVTYTYTIDNTAGTFDIGRWSLEFPVSPDWDQLDSTPGVSVPNADWLADVGTAILPGQFAQDFFSFGPTGDVLIGGVLGFFSFTTRFLPGTVTFHEFSADGGSSASGQVIGPAFAPASVPDGGTRGLEAIALLSLAAFGARRQVARQVLQAA